MDVIQWEADVEAEVRIWPAPEFDAGLGHGRPVHLRVPIVAGSIGLVIDARGRPLVWPDAPDARQAWVGQWHRALNAYPAATAESSGRFACHLSRWTATRCRVASS